MQLMTLSLMTSLQIGHNMCPDGCFKNRSVWMPTFIILSSIAADKRHSDLSAKLYSIFILTREQQIKLKKVT